MKKNKIATDFSCLLKYKKKKPVTKKQDEKEKNRKEKKRKEKKEMHKEYATERDLENTLDFKSIVRIKKGFPDQT